MYYFVGAVTVYIAFKRIISISIQNLSHFLQLFTFKSQLFSTSVILGIHEKFCICFNTFMYVFRYKAWFALSLFLNGHNFRIIVSQLCFGKCCTCLYYCKCLNYKSLRRTILFQRVPTYLLMQSWRQHLGFWIHFDRSDSWRGCLKHNIKFQSH